MFFDEKMIIKIFDSLQLINIFEDWGKRAQHENS